MKMLRDIHILTIVLLSYCLIILGCKKSENPVLYYFENAELQYEGKIQEENILTALNDILSSTKEQLKSKRYKDYTGKEDQWDLPTLIYSHFVSDKKGSKTLGKNFYHDVKSKEVQKKIRQIIEEIEQSPWEFNKGQEVIDPYKYVWEKGEGNVSGMRRFYLDIDDDKVPDLFLGANALFGNADRIFEIGKMGTSDKRETLGETARNERN